VTDPEYMRRYYRMRMDRAIAYLGGACAQCGSTEDLEIDHVDPSVKSFTIASAGWKKSWEILKAELQKCQLLCSQHHRVKTSGDLGVPHGGGKSGKMAWVNGKRRGCPCELCTARRREYNATFRPRRRAGLAHLAERRLGRTEVHGSNP
jgi:hypothetical protein